jgi:hypothetical protein
MKVEIYKIIKRTSGRFHSWCQSTVGNIRKPNNKIREVLEEPEEFVSSIPSVFVLNELSWYRKLWYWIKHLFSSFT